MRLAIIVGSFVGFITTVLLAINADNYWIGNAWGFLMFGFITAMVWTGMTWPETERPIDPVYAAQRAILDWSGTQLADPDSTPESLQHVSNVLMAIGPIKGSQAAQRDHLGRCFHLGPYPGCAGGCNH